jgi:hypothetical protein
MLSDYVYIRQANIERNNKFLSELGIDGVALNVDKKRPVTKRLKLQRSVISEDVMVRRSSRLLQLDVSPDYVELNALHLKENKLSRSEDDLDDTDNLVVNKRKIQTSATHSYSKDSSRYIDADLSYLLSEGLGCFIGDVSTKATIMAIANHGIVPSFSKYEGSAVWRNCIFLWINYNDPKNEVQNVYTNSNASINWYGGSR